MRKGIKAKPEEIISILRQIEILTNQGRNVDMACREAGITEQDYYRWSYDFVQDKLYNGKKIRMLMILDGFIRKCLRIEVNYSLKSNDLIEILSELFVTEGGPEYIRSDNGLEFVAKKPVYFLLQIPSQDSIYYVG